MPGDADRPREPEAPSGPRQAAGKRRLPLWLVPVLLLAVPLLVLAGFTLGGSNDGGQSRLPGFVGAEGRELVLEVTRDNQGIADFLRRLAANDIDFKDLHTSDSSLEDIFVDLLRKPA